MTQNARSVRIQVVVALMCAALLTYIVLLGRTAVLMIASGRGVAIALGSALLIMPAIGLWAMIATLRAGLAHQKLARLAAEDGTGAPIGRDSPRLLCVPREGFGDSVADIMGG